MKWFALTIILVIVSFFIGLNLGKTSELPTLTTSATSTKHDAVAVTQDQDNYTWHEVVKVVDGDTLTIAMNGKNVTLRLIGLDTPESVDPRTTVQCFGKEASDKAKQLLGGTSVRIEKDPSQGELDKYGRLLAYVYVPTSVRPEGILVNEYMIAEGYGHEYTYNLPYKYQTEFKEAERKAREEKKGLWADDACDVGERISHIPMLISGKQYECSENTYNCSDFKKQAEAQAVFDSCGGSVNDIHKLDSDADGEVCESLP